MNKSKTFASVALPLLALSSMLSAARNNGNGACEPTPPAACNQDVCSRTYCLGPDTYAANPPLKPVTCNGDWVINASGFYWNAHQEGLDYAIVNDQIEAAWRSNMNYINASIETPDFKWDFGFKLGAGYNTTCDGWDFNVNWTWYRGKANSQLEAEVDDNQTILALLSNWGDPQVFPTVTDAQADWKLNLNLVDFELGREFWSGKCLSLRPFVGLRYASIRQDYNVAYRGGSFSTTTPPENDYLDIDNDFRGVGIRSGLNSVWNLSCGWGLYSNCAVSILYGRFDVDVNEYTRETRSPHTKLKHTEIENNFHASRYIADLALGVQWSALLCDHRYGITVGLGWEYHMFLNQNQLCRFNHQAVPNLNPPVFGAAITPLRGDLDTQGWTLSVKFEF